MDSFINDRSTKQKLAILSFHKIGEPSAGGWESWFYVPEKTFVSYLNYFQENGWQFIDIMSFLNGLDAPDMLPQRAVLLTFDDGYRSMREVALPWLRRFESPAVLFVPTDYIGGHNTFDNGSEPEEAICDWDDLRELERFGVSIQSHGVSHRAFSTLEPIQQELELIRSKTLLESNLGRSVELFAFPYGDSGVDKQKMTKMLKKIGYRAAFLYGGGPVLQPIADPYRLPRLAMGPDSNLQAALEEGARFAGVTL